MWCKLYKPHGDVNRAQPEGPTDKGNPCWTCLIPTVILRSFKTALMAYSISPQENAVAGYHWRPKLSGRTSYSATEGKVENLKYLHAFCIHKRNTRCLSFINCVGGEVSCDFELPTMDVA